MNRSEFVAMLDMSLPYGATQYPTLDDYQRALDHIHADESRAERRHPQAPPPKVDMARYGQGEHFINATGSAYPGLVITTGCTSNFINSTGCVIEATHRHTWRADYARDEVVCACGLRVSRRDLAQVGPR